MSAPIADPREPGVDPASMPRRLRPPRSDLRVLHRTGACLADGCAQLVMRPAVLCVLHAVPAPSDLGD